MWTLHRNTLTWESNPGPVHSDVAVLTTVPPLNVHSCFPKILKISFFKREIKQPEEQPTVCCAVKVGEYWVISRVTQLGAVVPRHKKTDAERITLLLPSLLLSCPLCLSIFLSLSHAHINTLTHILRWCRPKANESSQTFRMDEAAVIVWGGEEAPGCWNSLGTKRNEIQALICQGVCLLFPRLWLCEYAWGFERYK